MKRSEHNAQLLCLVFIWLSKIKNWVLLFSLYLQLTYFQVFRNHLASTWKKRYLSSWKFQNFFLLFQKKSWLKRTIFFASSYCFLQFRENFYFKSYLFICFFTNSFDCNKFKSLNSIYLMDKLHFRSLISDLIGFLNDFKKKSTS